MKSKQKYLLLYYFFTTGDFFLTNAFSNKSISFFAFVFLSLSREVSFSVSDEEPEVDADGTFFFEATTGNLSFFMTVFDFGLDDLEVQKNRKDEISLYCRNFFCRTDLGKLIASGVDPLRRDYPSLP